MPNVKQVLGKDSSGGSGSDSRYFTTQKKGEMHELKVELHSTDRNVKVDAVKKVIASMTVGKDVSMLFPDVLNCVQTGNIELKKLVYLYLINYAKSQPELTLLAVNTFVKDSKDPNPLIRALAVRTMGCIRVDRITEYLCEPLRVAIRDEDPYVRKTAAVCVAKLYDIAPNLVEDAGFLETLHDLISDSNPSVVANGVAALSEIAETSGRDVMKISASVLQKLLAALNECTEWGQVFILDSLAKYTPADGREAEGIIERVTPRLQHANSAVVMSAVKVILSYMEIMSGASGASNADAIRNLTRKLAPPLVTLLNSEAEIQYVALRNINLIVQKRPTILENEIKVFFCKYNDPIYVKMEKLEIIIKLVSEKNIEQVLLELKEYATEVDVDFVRKSVSAIGRCAVKLERAAERCIGVLLELIQTKVNYVVQESVIVIKDIFRRYPNRYESIIATLCDNLDTLDEPLAKASMIWIIGEYAERIDNADELLDNFLETFEEEDPAVQLQLLTATVKCFLKNPEDTQDMVQRVLDLATVSVNPDLRDRGFIYWRLLSTDPEAAKLVVLGDKPVIEDDTFKLEPNLLNILIGQIATLSSIYHKPPEAFVVRADGRNFSSNIASAASDDIIEEGDEEEDYEDEGGDAGDNGVDLLDMGGMGISSKSETPAVPTADDIFGAPSTPQAQPARMSQVSSAAKSDGIDVLAGFRQVDGKIFMELELQNVSCASPLSGLAIQLNKNAFGLSPTNQQIVCNPPVPVGSKSTNSVELTVTPAMLAPVPAGQPASSQVQVAIKNMATKSVFYFAANFNLEALFSKDGTLERTTFIETWKNIDDQNELNSTISDLPVSSTDIEQVQAKFLTYNIFFIARRPVPNTVGQEVVYFSMKTVTGIMFLAELTFKQGVNACKICVKTQGASYGSLAKLALEDLLRI